MATVTVTLQASLDQPRSNPSAGGVVAKTFSNAAPGATFGAAADVMRLAKIPNKASIIDVVGWVTCAATSVQGVLTLAEVLAGGTLSVYATPLCSLSAVTAGGPVKTGIFIPSQVSITDTAAIQYAMLAIKASGGTQSTSVYIRGTVLYETSDSPS